MGSKSQVVGYKYYMPMHIVSGLSRGPTAAGITVRDCMFEFRAGDRTAWSGAIYENGTISINAPDLFGGDEKEGGVVGSMDVMFGAPDQGVNAYLAAQQGDPQSAHRGLFSLVWKGGQVCSNNPYLKPWAVARRRITGGWYGECWYPGKAPIPLGSATNASGEYGILITGSPASGETAVFVAATVEDVPSIVAIPESTGADLAGATATYGDGTWVAATKTGTRHLAGTLSTSATWSTGTLSATNDIEFVEYGGTEWAAKERGGPYSGVTSASQAFSGSPDAFTTASPVVYDTLGNVLATRFQMLRYINGYWYGSLVRSLHRSTTMAGPFNAVWDGYKNTAAGWDNNGACIIGFYDGVQVGERTYFIVEWHFNVGLQRHRIWWSPDGGVTMSEANIEYDAAYATAGYKPVQLIEVGGKVVALCDDFGVLTNASGAFARVETGMPTFPTTGGADDVEPWRSRRIATDGSRVYIVGGSYMVVSLDKGLTWGDPIALPISSAKGIAVGVGASPPSEGARYCMNPAHIVYQCLTDPNCLGYPTAVIDDASFTAAADQLYAEGLGLNLKWSNRETIENFIGIVCDHAGMILLKDRRTGLYKLRLLRDDYNVEDLRVFTPSNSRIVSLQRPSPADIVNELQVTYTDYKTFKEATIPVRDAAAVQAMGRIVSKSHSLTGLPTESLAVRCGDRDLAAMTQPLWRIDMAFLRDADDLEPGEPFVLDYPASELFPEGLYVVLRVADEINYGNAANGSITAKCVQDVFSLPLVGSTGSLPDIDDGSPGDPEAATALVFEATYRDLAGILTATDLAALPEDAGYIAGVAVRPNDDHRGFTLATRIDPAAYADAAEGLFSPSCTLAADIAPGQTVLPVTGWTDMAGLDVGEPLIIGSDENAEWVRVDAIAGDGSTITVGRGCVDTVPKPWPSGTRLWAYDAFAAADTTQYIDGETVDAKVLPRTSSARLPLADAALIQTTMAHRAARPLPPGGLLLNDAPFYDVGGPVIPSPPGGGGGGGGTTTPSTPPPLTPNGTPATTTPGPNGGYADDAPYPIPPPTTLGTDVLPGGDFGDPADLGQWRNRDGSALGAGWSLVDGKLTHIGGGVAAAYCYGARLSLPISPIPRYTVSVEMDVQCDPSVVTRVGIAWGVSTNGGTPNYVEASEAATYPAEVTVSHEWTRVVERVSMLGAGTIPVVTFMPYVEHAGALGGSLATVDNAHLVITEVPTPSTPETPDHIDFDAGLTGWTLWPDPTSANPYAPTMAVSGGELSMTVTSEYFTYRWVICDDPLVGADAIGKYIGALFDAWCNDNSTITDATGTYTFGGAAFGVATKLPGQDYVPFTGSLPQRGDWTEREAWVRQILDDTNAPGVTTHVAMLLRCSVGKTVKVRNIQPRVTDGVID